MVNVVDVDALIAEESAQASTTLIRLHGREWRFRNLADIPTSLFTDEARSGAEELAAIAALLSEAIVDDQRAEFAELTLTVRQAWATFNALIRDQQGVEPGESQAS